MTPPRRALILSSLFPWPSLEGYIAELSVSNVGGDEPVPPITSKRKFHNYVTVQEIKHLIDSRRAKVLAFDLDGTTAFTEVDQMTQFAALTSELSGVRLSFDDVAREMLGKTPTDIMSIFKARYDLPHNLQDLVAERSKRYYASIKASSDEGKVRPNAFVLDLLHYAKGNLENPPIVVSNGFQKIQTGLLRHWGIADLFGVVHTCDTMKLKLPLNERKVAFARELPEVYGVKPSEVLFFDDSQGMINAVEDAGLTGVYVKHVFNAPFRPQSGLTFMCRSVRDKTLRLVAS